MHTKNFVSQIKVQSRQAFNAYCKEQDWNISAEIPFDVKVIEIIDTQKHLYNNKSRFTNADNVLVLYFDDIEYSTDTAIAFNEQQAIELYQFLLKDIESTRKFIVHCAAGISRSGAVGLFISDLLKQRYFKYKFPARQKINPNGLVSRLLNRQLLLENYDQITF